MEQNFINANNQNNIIYHPYPPQPGVIILSNSDYLKERLCCPRIWTGILFVCQFISLIVYIFTKEATFANLIYNIGITLVFFVVAYLVTKSASTCDVKKYKFALYIYFAYFIFLLVDYGFQINELAKEEQPNESDLQITISNFLSYLFGSLITLCILCCYKNEFYKINSYQINT